MLQYKYTLVTTLHLPFSDLQSGGHLFFVILHSADAPQGLQFSVLLKDT